MPAPHPSFPPHTRHSRPHPIIPAPTPSFPRRRESILTLWAGTQAREQEAQTRFFKSKMDPRLRGDDGGGADTRLREDDGGGVDPRLRGDDGGGVDPRLREDDGGGVDPRLREDDGPPRTWGSRE